MCGPGSSHTFVMYGRTHRGGGNPRILMPICSIVDSSYHVAANMMYDVLDIRCSDVVWLWLCGCMTDI